MASLFWGWDIGKFNCEKNRKATRKLFKSWPHFAPVAGSAPTIRDLPTTKKTFCDSGVISHWAANNEQRYKGKKKVMPFFSSSPWSHFELLHPWSLTAHPWKMMVGRLLSFWDGNFWRAILNFGGVIRHIHSNDQCQKPGDQIVNPRILVPNRMNSSEPVSGFGWQIIKSFTLPETAPENRPPQKETHLPTPVIQVLC